MTVARAARALPVLETEPARRGPDRSTDRRLTFAGLAVAIAFLLAALAALALPPSVRLGWWVPVHLVLAGAAGTAIAAMLPFFVAALAIAPPAPPAIRVTGLVLVATGAVAAVAGRISTEGGISAVAAGGAVAYAAGMAAVGLAVALSLRQAGVVRRPAMLAAYAIALVDVVLGVALVGLYLAGDETVASRWATLRAAHAWLNVLGFVTLAIAGTLLHFVPTVVGARIRPRRAGAAAIALLAVAAPLAAASYAVGPGTLGDLGIRAAAALGLVGAAVLALHGLQAQRDRVAWTTDLEWHRLTAGSLLAGPIWLTFALAIVGAGALGRGAGGSSWRLDHVVAPLVLGFVVQVVLGALSHLIPAVGPGSPAAHAAQRRILGRLGGVRLGAWNAGVAALSVGVLGTLPGAAAVGAALVLASGAATLAALILALLVRRRAEPRPSDRSDLRSGRLGRR